MRKTREVTIQDSDWTRRDAGKTFLLTEMSAAAAEKWAMRAMTLLARSGIDIPDAVLADGMRGLAIVGIRGIANLSFGEATQLMDEMFACVQIKEPALVRRLTDDDIEEVTTRLLLRSEVIDLHVGFSIAGRLSSAWPANPPAPDENSSSPPTSPGP